MNIAKILQTTVLRGGFLYPQRIGETMKTAILKTSLWDDDEFYTLNIDTKLLYLLLMSAPERGVSDIYSVSNRILSARSGLREEQLAICKTQLQEKSLVVFSGNFVKLAGSAYVLPKKGRFTKQALEREYKDVPVDVLKQLTDMDVNSSLIVEHYDSTIHKDKDNNKDINKNKDKVVVYGNTEVNEAFIMWEEAFGYKLASKVKANRNAASNLIKREGIDYIRRVIAGLPILHSKQFIPKEAKPTDFIQLQAHWNDVMAYGKNSATTKPKVVKI